MNATKLPEGVKLKWNWGNHPYEVNYDGEIPIVKAEARGSGTLEGGGVVLTVAGGAACDLLVYGDKDGDARVVGKGHGNASRTGSGKGTAARMGGEGTGNAYRLGEGAGDAFSSAAGRGDAVRRGDGDGNARCRSEVGNAIRSGTGHGNAVRYGQGGGKALREDEGDGNAVVRDGSNGNARRFGRGSGHAVHLGGGDGDALRRGDGEGRCFTEPEMTMAGWEQFIREWVKGEAKTVAETPVSQWHWLAERYRRRVKLMLEGNRDRELMIPILVASDPNLGKSKLAVDAEGDGKHSLLEGARKAIEARLERAALGAIRELDKLPVGENPQQGVSLDLLKGRVVFLIDACIEIEDVPVAKQVVEEMLVEGPISMPQLSEIFANNPSLWENRGSGESLEEQMRSLVVGHLMKYAQREIEIRILSEDEAQGSAAPGL